MRVNSPGSMLEWLICALLATPGIMVSQQRVFGDPRALPVRDIPARSLVVAIADQAWSHLSGFCQVDVHDPVAGERDSTAATVLTVA